MFRHRTTAFLVTCICTVFTCFLREGFFLCTRYVRRIYRVFYGNYDEIKALHRVRNGEIRRGIQIRFKDKVNIHEGLHNKISREVIQRKGTVLEDRLIVQEKKQLQDINRVRIGPCGKHSTLTTTHQSTEGGKVCPEISRDPGCIYE